MRGLSRSSSAVELNSQIGDDSHEAAAAAVLNDESLMQIDKHQILREVDEFVTEYDLHSIRGIMRNGAMWFYHPHDLAQIEADMPYLGDQIDPNDQRGPRRGPSLWAIYASTVLIVIQTLDSTDGIVLFEPVIETDGEYWRHWPPRYPKGFWRSFFLAIVGPLIGATLGYLLSLYMNGRLGRRRAIRQLCIITPIASLGVNLPLGRQILSIASIILFALSASTVSTIKSYIFEIVEPSKRKSTMLKVHFSQVPAGFLFGVIIGIEQLKEIDMPLIKICFTVTASAVIFFLSSNMIESPYWLVLKGDIKSAYGSLRESRRTDLVACRDLYQIYVKTKQHRSKHAEQFGVRDRSRTIEIFTNGRVRPIFATCTVIALSMDYSSSSAVIFATDTSEVSWAGVWIKLSMVIGVLGLIWAVILRVDKFGRRPILIGLMSLVLLSNLVPFVFPWRSWGFGSELPRMITDISLVIFAYPTQIPLMLYLWEAFPLLYRDIGSSLVTSVLLAASGVHGIFYKTLKNVGLQIPYSPILISLPIAIVLAFFYMEETSKLPLEYLGDFLEISPRGMNRYRFFVYLPYIFKRYILRKDTALETFEESRFNRGAIHLNYESIAAFQGHGWSLDS